MKKKITNPQKGIIFWLAMKDMYHEKLITINLVLGTAAIIAPLLILFGIKFGIIETMSNRLVNDPKNLEIRPISSQSYATSWFNEIKKNKHIDFIIPMTRQLSSSVKIKALSLSSKSVTAELMATNDGDPLLLQNFAIIPDTKSCVISNTLAEETGLKEGDSLKCSVTRYTKNKIEESSITLKVISILTPRAGFRKAIYVPLSIVENMEKYKDGLAISQWGWKGKISEAYSVYDGVFISLPKKLDRIEQIKLLSGTGFAYIDEITHKEAKQKAGYSFKEENRLYFIKPFKNSVNSDNIESLKIKLRGKNAELIQWVKPMKMRLEDSNITITLAALSKNISNIVPMVLYCNEAALSQDTLHLNIDSRTLSIPVKIMKMDTNASYCFMDTDTVGEIALFRQRNLTYDTHVKKILLARKGYAGFRAYAKTLEDVAYLKHYFESKGIKVSTQAARIHEVQELDKYLTLIFWLIAIVGVVGGAATLSASLYSAVERKRKELSILRLLGLSAGMIFRFPIYQGTVIAMSGVTIALFFFFVMATIINALFADHLEYGESFCTLDVLHIGIVFLSSIGLAILSSIIAAYQATKTDPAEAMRSE